MSPCVCVQKKDKGEQAPSPMRGLEWKYSRERFLAAGVADRLRAVLAGITLCTIGCLRPNVPNHLHSPLPSAKSTRCDGSLSGHLAQKKREEAV